MNKVIFMVGIVGSNKSTESNRLKEECIANNKEVILLSSDTMRKELFGEESSQQDNTKVFDYMYTKAVQLLKSNDDITIILDATNINSKRRRHAITMLNQRTGKPIVFEARVMATPYNACIANNKGRERVVPNDVITRMYKAFQMPHYFEGFDDIEIVYNNDYDYSDTVRLVDMCIDFNQYNKNHKLTLDTHQIMAWEYLFTHNEVNDNSLLVATRYHDVGKPYCMSFMNHKGEFTNNATYYNHDSVGAYEFMMLLNTDDSSYIKRVLQSKRDVVETICLINYHMKHYFLTTDVQRNKFRLAVGDDFYNRLILLNEADKFAH